MTLAAEIDRVVRNGNCTGCGGCAWLFDGINMGLDDAGYMRPQYAPSFKGEAASVSEFRSMCPGVGVRDDNPDAESSHGVFGRYVSAWQGWATDGALRFRGSSGGVLSALSAWSLEKNPDSHVVASRSDPERPARTTPVRIMSREEVEEASSSRYAPVANLPMLGDSGGKDAFVGKPCEAAAARQHFDATRRPTEDRPLLLSFFCAGTPSQTATDRLAASLGIPAEQAVELRYRGMGWPGDFTVAAADGRTGAMSYHDSWGGNLGRALQWRCKLCPHGTGNHADISVGDYWRSDDNGYPLFEDAAGNSVVIARTRRGHEALLQALEDGVIKIEPIDLEAAARVQPLQRTRGSTLIGRLVGRVMGGRRVPRYRGFHLLEQAVRDPVRAIRAMGGTAVRTFKDSRAEQGRIAERDGV